VTVEVALRQVLGDPIFGVPILLMVLVVVAHVAVFLRSVAAGATPIIPSLRTFGADVAIVLLVLLMFVMTKAIDLFTPTEGATVGGIDLGPLYSVVGPLVFAAAGLALAVWLAKKKIEAILTSVQPPTIIPSTTTTITSTEPPTDITVASTGTTTTDTIPPTLPEV
jgi:hypothetical protein